MSNTQEQQDLNKCKCAMCTKKSSSLETTGHNVARPSCNCRPVHQKKPCRCAGDTRRTSFTSTARFNDFNNMYRQNQFRTTTTTLCYCSANPYYANIKELTYSSLKSSIPIKEFTYSSLKPSCKCSMCKLNKSPFKQCSCSLKKNTIKFANSCNCPKCKNIKESEDETDGKDSAMRTAAIAENVLEYEISALEYGISVVEGAAKMFGRDLYVKDIEPKYQNVREFVIEEKPQYANLEEITEKYGDRLGPEGQNLEDEVFYENVKSARGTDKDQQAASLKILSASTNSLEKFRLLAPEFYSGTFPQYHQKDNSIVSGKVKGEKVKKKVRYALDNTNDSDSLSTEVTKKEMCEVKQQRLWLAQDEYKHLSSALTALATSRTSLCSSGSGGSARYDPELLRSDVALARERVARLRRELRQVRAELSCTQQGVDTLHSVEQKISTQQGSYNITEAQAIMTELRNIQKSLTSGEKEKAELMQSLAKLKDDLTRLQLGEVSPDISTLSLPQEKLSTASQTDLCADLVPIGTRLAEMARMRLQYDESRKRIQHIQQQLADLEDKVQPGQAESDKDRLLLFQEKEQLLRELRSITPRTRTKQEMTDIQLECKRLEQDLNNALEMSNRCIADRLKLHEEKQLLLQQLRDALRSMTMLESQLKSLSASTLSVSSSSSLGSLSTTSSKGSLSSGLSFTDIYGGPQCISGPVPLGLDKPIDMVDLHRRVERLLQGSSSGSALVVGSGSQPSLSPRSSLSSVSPPVSPPAAPPPAYDLLALRPSTLDRTHLEERLAELRAVQNSEVDCLVNSRLLYEGLSARQLSDVACGRTDPPLSPISETPPPLSIEQEDLLQSTSGALSGTPNSSGTNSRSVSAAVSDESVAGDSGVFEASCRSRNLHSAPSSEPLAQVQIKLQYSQEEQTLYVGIQKIRNLHVLTVKENELIYIRAIVLPAAREAGAPLPAPLRLPLPLPSPILRAQTLRLQACRRNHCLGFALVSLADFSTDSVSLKWYNIVGLSGALEREVMIGAPNEALNTIPACREESSDESTLIPSQTSTLTRNQSGGDSALPSAPVESPVSTDDEDDEDDDDENDEAILMLGTNGQFSSSMHQIMEEESYIDPEIESTEEQPEENDNTSIIITCTEEKETNTECNFCPEAGKRKISCLSADDRLAIKRSQTFSPTPQLTKTQYICRLNRSESDSSMPLYRRGGSSHLLTGNAVPFDRHAAARRSLRWGRPASGSTSIISVTGRAPRSQHAPRTSLDLELDLRAQHHRLQNLNREIKGLRDLKHKLEVAREKGDPAVATWAAEDMTLAQLCEQGGTSTISGAVASTSSTTNTNQATNKRAAKALQRACRDLYRLRRTKAPRGKPDLITFREKMAFFCRYQSTVPVLPIEEDTLDDASSDTLKRSDMEHLSRIFGELDCETNDSSEFVDEEESKDCILDGRETPDGCHDLQVGYQVRRSGRCQNMVEKSQELFEDDKAEEDVSEDVSEVLDKKETSVVTKSEKIEENGETKRYQYVVDRVLGVQV